MTGWFWRRARKAEWAQPIIKILIKFAQKHPVNSNNSFRPVCYGLSQRRRKSRGELLRVRVMFFLLRMAFWLGVVCVLFSVGGKSASPEAQIDASQAVTLASAAVSDVRGFCERQPDACETGGKVAVALGHKAEAGARTLYDLISKLREKPAEKADNKATPASVAGKGTNSGTLTPADMAPAWHAPVPVPLPPRRDARADRAA